MGLVAPDIGASNPWTRSSHSSLIRLSRCVIVSCMKLPTPSPHPCALYQCFLIFSTLRARVRLASFTRVLPIEASVSAAVPAGVRRPSLKNRCRGMESQIARSRSLVIKNVPVGLSEASVGFLLPFAIQLVNVEPSKGVLGRVKSCRTGAYILAHSLVAEGNGADEVAMQRMRCCRFIDYRTTQEALAAIAGLHNKPPFYLKVNLSTMSLSERWKFDARKKEELEEIRRKIEERHGLPAYNVPSQPGAGRGKGLLASYAAEDAVSPQKPKDKAAGDRTGPQAGLPKKPQGPARSPIKPNKPSSQPRTPPAQPESRPPASKPPPSSDKLEPATLPQGGPTEVTLCFGNDLSEFYLQCSSKAAELTQLQADLQALCASNRGFQPAVGEACAALFADDKQWYRATVTSAGPNCVVYFVDYGNTAPVAAENMCRIPDKCMRLPAQAIRCRLHGVRPLATTGAWTEEAFSELAGVLQEGPLVAKLLRRAEGFHEVELAAKAGGESLNQRLVSKGLGESVAPVAAPTAAPSVVPPRGPPAAQRMRSVLSLAQVGETLPLQVTVSAHEQVWTLAVLPEVAMALVKVEEALQAEGAQATSTGGHPPQGISCGSYVASQSSEDGRWYRAYVTRMAGQEVSVRYVDYGNDESKTKVIALSPEHVSAAPAAAVRLLTSDPRSYFAGQLLSFAVESIEGTTVRGTVTSDADGKGLGTLALAAWDYGLPSEEPAAAAASPRAKSVAAPPATSPPQKASSPAAPPPTSRAAEAKVLHVPQRKLPATKCPMVPVWKTPDVLYLQQQGLAPELEAMMAALNAWVKAEQPRPSEVNYSKGDYVCALFSEDSKWYRGKVRCPPACSCTRNWCSFT
ncbi:hypothetical protein HPB48_011841 [Haemaphysalis longicornis]|uniref:Tudor domain-containing protein n=1 Tax=Haemaphysalis longicornis TaxID=44386 RepID=A0A9J6FK76_HAELO|nr:hypothetical protein HPB48_011841 [Haemaphysalis longicornis]